MSEKNPAFSIHYDRKGTPVDVSSDDENVTIAAYPGLPPDLKTEKVVNTTIIVGEHNPRCRYIWIPRRGWVWVCW